MKEREKKKKKKKSPRWGNREKYSTFLITHTTLKFSSFRPTFPILSPVCRWGWVGCRLLVRS